MRRSLALLSAALFALSACDSADPALSSTASVAGGARWAGPDTPALAEVPVMTQNLYLGAEILQLLDPSCSGFPLLLCVDRLYDQALASDFPARAEGIADEIARVRPALVGLQEVTTYATQTPSDFVPGAPPNATTVTVDFLAVLLDALAERGLSYTAVSISRNIDVELPAFDGQAPYDVRYSDADVVLALNDPDVETGATTERRFRALVTFSVGGVPVQFARGYQTVEATVDGLDLTFVNAHLEVGGAAGPVQEAQAAELKAGLDAIAGPLVLVGDLNSPADGSGTRSYSVLTGALTDVFSRPNLTAEPTCCQAADLLNFPSELEGRIDFVLYRGVDQARKAETVLDDPGDRVESGERLLWPSDHAGVAALLVRNLRRNRIQS